VARLHRRGCKWSLPACRDVGEFSTLDYFSWEVRYTREILVFVLGSACSTSPSGPPRGPRAAGVAPPVAAKRPQQVVSPSGTRNDPYFWLRDDSRRSPEVLAYLAAESEYAEGLLAPTRALQSELYQELIGRLKEDDASVPTLDNGYWYYEKTAAGKEYPILARCEQLDGEQVVLHDQNRAAQGFDFYQAGGYEVSQDNRYLAYAEDTVGRNQYTLRILDLRTGQYLSDTVANISPNVAWANDSKTLFYIEKHPTTLLGYKVRRHTLGADTADDPVVYEEKDTSFYIQLGRTKSDDYVTIYLGSTVTSEVHLIDANEPTAEPKVFLARERDHEYSLDHLNGRFVVVTNWQAQNFRVMEAPEVTYGDRATWREIVAHRDDALVYSAAVFDEFLAVSERSHGLRKVRVVPNRGDSFVIDGDEPAYAMYLSDLPEPDGGVVRYSYTSLTTPMTTYELHLATGERKLLKREPVLGDFDSANYQVEYVHAVARDGTRIPVSIVYRKGTARDGTASLVQYGYGAYGATVDPTFNSTRLSLLDRGVVFAIAHVRGGQAMGRAWYDAGRLTNKKNTFTDFIDVTRFLVKEGYGAPGKVIGIGESAGGLLMAAIANMAPELYRGIVARVPFVDVVTTMLDTSIPLTSNEFDEWGDPRKKEHYEYMLSYSPYDNVAARDYPAMLVETGLHDSQVQYWEPAKWVAKLRAHKTDHNPLLLLVNMNAGHGGKSGRYQHYRELARHYAWILHTLSQPDTRAPFAAKGLGQHDDLRHATGLARSLEDTEQQAASRPAISKHSPDD
jgi:oligopeptidase B